MSFNAAALVATIRLDGAEKLGRDLNTVRGRLNDTDAAIAKVRAAGKAAFDQTAAGVGAASVAVGILTSNLFAQGVAYNQLQQTSRAALRTLLGGAEAANAQMDKLDAFARTSPFSKAVFISAQQQLIGFGFEAQKVIPILNAVQDSVAAVGGSNAQISEIVSILAKIRSSGKLTAEDLNMLGERGLDAATLLGQGFNKTAADIRKDITDGTLDANEAIDVLVSQMGTKFAGAASNVKETFAGTTDRIKAASRDIGAALAEPFVAKNGGGQAVVWGNQVADVLRAVESHVKPVVTILWDEATPAVNGVTEALDRARVQIRAWDSSRVSDGLKLIGDNGPAVAAAAAAILAVNSKLLAGIPILGSFLPAIGPIPAALVGIALASPEVRTALGDLLGEMKPLVPVAVELAGVVSDNLNLALPIAADVIGLAAGAAKPLVEIISAIPAPMLATVAATIAVTSALRSNAPALQRFVDGIRNIADQVAVQSALAAMEGNTGRFSGALELARAKATGLMNSLKAAFISNPVGLIILGLSTAAAVLTAAFTAQAEEAKAAREQIDTYRDTLDQATGAVLRATRAEVEKTLADKGALDAAEKLGLSRQTVIDAVFGEEEALAAVRKAYEDNAGATGDYLTAGADLRKEAGLLNSVVKEQSGLLQDAEQQTRDDAQAKREAAAASTELERSNTRVNEALAIARDVSRDATERLKALKLALDELKGGAKSQAEVTRNLNEQTDRLREVFLATNDAGERLASGLVNGAGQIDTTTAAGRALFDEVGRLNDQMLDAILIADKDAKARGESGVSMETAREIASRYQGTLRDLASEAGLSEEQVSGLIATMLSTPEVVAYAVTDDGTIDANKLRMVDLATQILATPDKQFEIRNEDAPALMEALRVLGVTIQTLPNGTVSVKKDDVTFGTVESALNAIARDRTASIRTQLLTTAIGGGAIPDQTPEMLRRAGGGPVWGSGTSTSDSIPAKLSNDEHVVAASEVRGFGGHAEFARMRALAKAGRFTVPAFAEGGRVGLGVQRDLLPVPAPITLRANPAHSPGSNRTADAPVLPPIHFGNIVVPPGMTYAEAVAMVEEAVASAIRSVIPGGSY
ncbi:tape measure protein [Microbacterium sp. NPDC089190]|uniref:tape measure protein n=1 Tax=Microbacterium sp. NPDC089190 TaxID=3155063 RepID=UPI00344EE27C